MADKILSQTELSTFCSGLSSMLRAGFASDRAVQVFAEDTDSASGRAAAAMCSALERGAGFADAAESTGVFPEYALGVFRTAEMSGRLDEALESLAGYYEQQHELNLRIKNTLTYPVALMLMMCAVLAVLVFRVLPMFERVYESMTGSVAASSYAYVLAASAVSRVSLAAAGVVSVALLSLSVALRSHSAREKLRAPMEKFALTRRAALLMAVSELMDMLTTLISSGMDQDAALEQAMLLTRHSGLKAVLDGCMEKQREGMSLAQSFCGTVLTGVYGRMLLGGAESGRLESVLTELSRRIGADAAQALDALIDRIEPILIGFLTVSVGMTLLSVMLPLLGILGAV